MSTPETRNIVDEQGYEFFSCYKCGELITCLELSRALNTTGKGCRCGCMKVQPTEVKVEQYTQRNVCEMAIYLKKGVEEYVDDFLREAEILGWDRATAAISCETIRRHFSELLPCN